MLHEGKFEFYILQAQYVQKEEEGEWFSHTDEDRVPHLARELERSDVGDERHDVWEATGANGYWKEETALIALQVLRLEQLNQRKNLSGELGKATLPKKYWIRWRVAVVKVLTSIEPLDV